MPVRSQVNGAHMQEEDYFDRLVRNVAGLNAKFPDGNDPFQIMTRLCEEAGELAQAVIHIERGGAKVEKYGLPDLEHLADEVPQVYVRRSPSPSTEWAARGRPTATADCRRRGNATCTTYTYLASANMMWHS